MEEFPDFFKEKLQEGDKMAGEPCRLEKKTPEEITTEGLKPSPASSYISVKKQYMKAAWDLLNPYTATKNNILWTYQL